jgi:hypothetical protein
MLDLLDHDDLLVSISPDVKRRSLHINGKYRGFVVRKLKSVDWNRIRIFLEVTRTGMRVNRRKGVNRASKIGSLYRIEEY